jgi:hypothetical protein
MGLDRYRLESQRAKRSKDLEREEAEALAEEANTKQFRFDVGRAEARGKERSSQDKRHGHSEEDEALAREENLEQVRFELGRADTRAKERATQHERYGHPMPQQYPQQYPAPIIVPLRDPTRSYRQAAHAIPPSHAIPEYVPIYDSEPRSSTPGEKKLPNPKRTSRHQNSSTPLTSTTTSKRSKRSYPEIVEYDPPPTFSDAIRMPRGLRPSAPQQRRVPGSSKEAEYRTSDSDTLVLEPDGIEEPRDDEGDEWGAPSWIRSKKSTKLNGPVESVEPRRMSGRLKSEDIVIEFRARKDVGKRVRKRPAPQHAAPQPTIESTSEDSAHDAPSPPRFHRSETMPSPGPPVFHRSATMPALPINNPPKDANVPAPPRYQATVEDYHSDGSNGHVVNRSVSPGGTKVTSKGSQSGSPEVDDDSQSNRSYGSNQATVNHGADFPMEEHDTIGTWLDSVVVGLEPHYLARRNVEVDEWPYNPVDSYEEPPGDTYGWDSRDRRMEKMNWQRCYNCKAVAQLTEGCNHMIW